MANSPNISFHQAIISQILPKLFPFTDHCFPNIPQLFPFTGHYSPIFSPKYFNSLANISQRFFNSPIFSPKNFNSMAIIPQIFLKYFHSLTTIPQMFPFTGHYSLSIPQIYSFTRPLFPKYSPNISIHWPLWKRQTNLISCQFKTLTSKKCLIHFHIQELHCTPQPGTKGHGIQ